MEREIIVQTAGRDALGSFAPDFAGYNDDAPLRFLVRMEQRNGVNRFLTSYMVN